MGRKPKHKRVEKVGQPGITPGDVYANRHAGEILEEVGAVVRDWIAGEPHKGDELREFLVEKIDVVRQQGFEDGWNDHAENPPK